MYRSRTFLRALLIGILAFSFPLQALASTAWPGSDGTFMIGAGDGLPSGFEPSGMAIHEENNELYVAGDDGDVVVLDLEGNLLNTFYPGGDLEGVAYANGSIYLGVEQPDAVIKIDESGNIEDEWDLTPWMDGDSFSANAGLEGLTFIEGDTFLAARQQDARIFEFELLAGGEVNLIDSWLTYYSTDLSGLYFDGTYIHALYDSNNRIVVMELDGTVVERYQVPGSNQEGIVLDGGTIYMAEDSGDVYHYTGYPVSAPVVEVESGPNLKVTNLKINASTHKVNYTLSNDGDEDVSDLSQAVNTIYVDGIEWQDRYMRWHTNASSIYSVAGGAKYRTWHLYRNELMNDFVEGDTHTLTVCIDADEHIEELDETDNCESVDWVYEANLPDLYTVANEFSNNTFSVTLGNSGNLDALRFSTGKNAIYLNGRRIQYLSWTKEADTRFLKSGKTSTIEYAIDPSLFTAGESYTLEYCIDFKSFIGEHNEDNNCDSLEFTY